MVQTLAGYAGRKALMEVNLLAARSLGLSAGDLASLVEERREGSRLGLSLQVTRFLLQTVSVAELRRCPLAELSLSYWAARRHLNSPDWLSTSSSTSSILAWSDCSHPASARLGVLILAETLLAQSDTALSLSWFDLSVTDCMSSLIFISLFL